MKNLRLAWRNIWRNKRRTLITVASIFFGVLLATLMTSMQEGIYSKMIDNVVSFYSGYMQIHSPDYWENKTLENTFVPNEKLLSALNENEVVKRHASRLENFTLISSGEDTKGAALIGVEPEAENNITGLSKWVTEGTYFTGDKNGVLVAINIANNLNISVGDSVVFLSQGYHGVTAAGLYPVIGILDFPTAQLDNMGVFMPLKGVQEFYSAPNRVTSIVVMSDNYSTVYHDKNILQKTIGKDFNVMTWDEMDPTTKQLIEGDRAQGVITKGILYILIGFGVFGTVIMMMAERKKELGVLVAIGMKKTRLARVLVYETILIGLVGVLVGFAVSIPIIQVLVSNPIPITGEAAKAYEQFGMDPVIYFGNEFGIFLNQLLIILGITVVVAIYPLSKVMRLKVTNALRG
jgi:putative ABC transport system permease protein